MGDTYNGVMKIRSALVPGSISIGKRIVDISPDANKRLKWFDYYYTHGQNARLTCRHFDISPQTFYRWLKRYNPKNLKTMESQSHRPKHVRQPTYSVELVNAVQRFRETYPRWGKDKIVILLRREGTIISASMVGYYTVSRNEACSKSLSLIISRSGNGTSNVLMQSESLKNTRLSSQGIS